MSGFVSRILSDRDQKLVEDFVRAIDESGLSPEEAVAGVAGISGRNARRYVEEGFRPTRMTQTTRNAMRQVIDTIGQEGTAAETSARSAPADYPDGGIATAEQIIETFGRPEALRRQAGHIPVKDAARAGYALAQRLQLPPAGMKRIMQWHDAIMEGEGASG